MCKVLAGSEDLLREGRERERESYRHTDRQRDRKRKDGGCSIQVDDEEDVRYTGGGSGHASNAALQEQQSRKAFAANKPDEADAVDTAISAYVSHQAPTTGQAAE